LASERGERLVRPDARAPALPNVQVVSPSKTASSGANPTTRVKVDYGFGERGRRLPSVDPDGSGFLGGYDEIFPGSAATPIPLLRRLPPRVFWMRPPSLRVIAVDSSRSDRSRF
jgi:hypothetical protein